MYSSRKVRRTMPAVSCFTATMLTVRLVGVKPASWACSDRAGECGWHESPWLFGVRESVRTLSHTNLYRLCKGDAQLVSHIGRRCAGVTATSSSADSGSSESLYCSSLRQAPMMPRDEFTMAPEPLWSNMPATLCAVPPCAPYPGTRKNVWGMRSRNAAPSLGCVAPTRSGPGIAETADGILAPILHQIGHMLIHPAAIGQFELLNLRARRIRGAHQNEHVAIGLPGGLHERFDAVEPRYGFTVTASSNHTSSPWKPVR